MMECLYSSDHSNITLTMATDCCTVYYNPQTIPGSKRSLSLSGQNCCSVILSVSEHRQWTV